MFDRTMHRIARPDLHWTARGSWTVVTSGGALWQALAMLHSAVMAAFALLATATACRPELGLGSYAFTCEVPSDCTNGVCVNGFCASGVDDTADPAEAADATSTEVETTTSDTTPLDTRDAADTNDAADTSGDSDTNAPDADVAPDPDGSQDTDACAGEDCGVSPLVAIANGIFSMGSAEAEAGRGTDEPSHDVVLSPYRIEQREVTNADYLACVLADACEPPTTCAAGTPTWTGPRSFPAAATTEPVRCVSWPMAKAYCEHVGRRLCTEAEWERACVGSALHRTFPWGDDWPVDPDQYANCKEGYCNDGYEMVAPVASFPDGAVPESGLLDMAGNVAEWVLDYYEPDAYTTGAQQDPKGPCDGLEPCEDRYVRVHRGGSFAVTDQFVRCASRGQRIADNAEPYLGIRCCADP